MSNKVGANAKVVVLFSFLVIYILRNSRFDLNHLKRTTPQVGAKVLQEQKRGRTKTNIQKKLMAETTTNEGYRVVIHIDRTCLVFQG